MQELEAALDHLRASPSHEGTLTLAPRASGGLRVTVQLPAAPSHTDG